MVQIYMQVASRPRRGPIEDGLDGPRWASMGAANGTNLYAGGIEAASRLDRGRPRWASTGVANGTNLTKEEKSDIARVENKEEEIVELI